MAGYAAKPLTQKLGIKSGFQAVFLHEPVVFSNILGSSLHTIHVAQSLSEGKTYDYIHLFVTTRDELETRAKDCVLHLSDHGMLWISWPKQSANISTDLTEQALRDILLPLGVVDTKVCAIDAVWSGLKFLRRRQT